jgi:hypothetical protein
MPVALERRAPEDDGAALARRHRELAQRARLADAGLTGNHHQAARSDDRAFQALVQRAELELASHEQDVPAHRRRPRLQASSPPGRAQHLSL